jgi:hypothetical protein
VNGKIVELGGNFQIPIYAKNVWHHDEPPRDVVYFEIDSVHSDEFLEEIKQFNSNCIRPPLAVEMYIPHKIEKFQQILVCHENNDAERIAYETLVVGQQGQQAALNVFYARWANTD